MVRMTAGTVYESALVPVGDAVAAALACLSDKPAMLTSCLTSRVVLFKGVARQINKEQLYSIANLPNPLCVYLCWSSTTQV